MPRAVPAHGAGRSIANGHSCTPVKASLRGCCAPVTEHVALGGTWRAEKVWKRRTNGDPNVWLWRTSRAGQCESPSNTRKVSMDRGCRHHKAAFETRLCPSGIIYLRAQHRRTAASATSRNDRRGKGSVPC
mmetsp:Transcript_38043/g.112628  ORF Transcript_38043/g.112628 Transcript_38043/m.112628 type:complete len:131 (-) Transcript_38043:717-1109(-)